MNKLSVYNNVDFGDVRVIQINNEPWFVGGDNMWHTLFIIMKCVTSVRTLLVNKKPYFVGKDVASIHGYTPEKH